MFNMITVYALPLVVIIVSYSLILCEMTRKTRESKEDVKAPSKMNASERLRRSNVGHIQRARIRTLRLTIMMVLVFILCWTPYFVMSSWWWFDSESAAKVDPRIQKGLFLFAVSNSCMDPIVYGMFSLNLKHEFQRCCCCVKKPLNTSYYEMVTASAMLQAGNPNRSPSQNKKLREAVAAEYLLNQRNQSLCNQKHDQHLAVNTHNRNQERDSSDYLLHSESVEYLCPNPNAKHGGNGQVVAAML